jgi:hypothetical protein
MSARGEPGIIAGFTPSWRMSIERRALACDIGGDVFAARSLVLRMRHAHMN